MSFVFDWSVTVANFFLKKKQNAKKKSLLFLLKLGDR